MIHILTSHCGNERPCPEVKIHIIIRKSFAPARWRKRKECPPLLNSAQFFKESTNNEETVLIRDGVGKLIWFSWFKCTG